METIQKTSQYDTDIGTNIWDRKYCNVESIQKTSQYDTDIGTNIWDRKYCNVENKTKDTDVLT